MKSMNVARVLLVIAAIFLISVPLCMMMKSEAGADETTESITTYNDDYVFFVIEENKTPLAASPFGTHRADHSVFMIIAVAFTLVVAFGYSIWYLGTRNRIDSLLHFLPQSIRDRLSSQISILHPVRAYQLSKETEYDVANIFFYL